MTVPELTRAMSNAEKLGDRVVSGRVSDVIRQQIDLQAEKESWSEEQKAEQIDRILNMVIKLSRPQEKVIAEEASVATEIESDVAAQEGESQEEYEARHGVNPDLRINPEDIVINLPAEIDSSAEASAEPASGEVDEVVVASGETVNESRFKTFMNRAKKALLSAEVRTSMALGRGMDKLKSDNSGKKENETDEEYEKRIKRNGRIMAVGIVAVAAVALAYRLNGLDHSGGGSDPQDISGGRDGNGNRNNSSQLGDRSGNNMDFSRDARTVGRGEGWYQTFDDMKIPASERSELIEKVGPKLVDRGYAYFDNAAGEYRISKPGQLPSSVLQLIDNSRNK